MPNIVIRPIDVERDAEGLAAMWNASEMEWPGGENQGVPITAQIARYWEEEWRTLVTFVAEVDGEIAGYCSFMESDRHKGEGVLDTLLVQPKYQRLGIGRRLIRATIERSVHEGWQRQTLGTWPANFKAVSLYKKTGYFWTPDPDDEGVWMQSFVPGALQLPLARPFFEKHDWCDCLVRELTQEPDDERWEGLKVFAQHWEADGESLTIWIDRGARAPVAIETDALLVAAIAEEAEPLAGSKVNLRWRVANKATQPLRVHLHALGDKGLTIDHRDAFLVPGGETVERLSHVEISRDAPQKKEDGTARVVRSILRLNDQEVELFSGLRVKKPISLNTAPAQLTLPPGVATPINLELHSEVDRAVAASLRLTLPEGLAADWATREVELPAKGHVAVPLVLTPSGECVYHLPVRVEFQDAEGLASVTENPMLFCLGAGGLLSHQQDDSVRLETDTLRVTVETKGGTIKVEHVSSRLRMLSLRPTVGPPYWPSDFEGVKFEVGLEQRGGRAIMHLAAEAKNYAGLYLHQELALSPTGLSTLRCYLENRSGSAHTKRLRFGVRPPNLERSHVTVPQSLGMIHGPASVYPTSAWDDMPRDPGSYAEPWLAWQRGSAVAGLAWDASAATIEQGRGPALTTVELLAPPGGRSREVRLAFYAGDGDWRDMRRVALRWAGVCKPKRDKASVRPPILARLEPSVLVTTSNRVEAHLVVDTASVRPASGRVTVATRKGVSVEPQSVPVMNLVRGKTVERSLSFALPKDALGVFKGEVRLAMPLDEVVQPFHLVRLGDRAPVTVQRGERSGQEIWTIDNGTNTFVVAPAFGPSLVAWEQGCANQLYSSFPEPQGFSWLYPWFGGVHSALRAEKGWFWEGYLSRETPAAEPIETVDASGLAWHGVRLTVRPTKREFKDLEVQTDYLTLGYANTLKYVLRLRNLRATGQAVRTDVTVACRLGAEPTGLTVRGEQVTRKPTPWTAEPIGAGYWGALTNERTAKTVLLVGRQPNVLLWDAGQHGRVLRAGGLVRLAGNEVHESTYYLVLADTLEKALGYRVLKDYAG